MVNYHLTCVSLEEGVDPVITTYNETESYTVEGFRPATQYNCSVFAANDIGNSPVYYTNVITQDDSEVATTLHFALFYNIVIAHRFPY